MKIEDQTSAAAQSDWERWAREVCTDFRIPFDNHTTGLRLAITQWMADRNKSEFDSEQNQHGTFSGLPEPTRDDQITGRVVSAMQFIQMGLLTHAKSELSAVLKLLQTVSKGAA